MSDLDSQCGQLAAQTIWHQRGKLLSTIAPTDAASLAAVDILPGSWLTEYLRQETPNYGCSKICLEDSTRNIPE